MKRGARLLKTNAGFQVVTHFGVSHLLNRDRSVAQFESWQDVDKGTMGAMSGHQAYQGVPVTQEVLDTYYPALKENTVLTKSKIGSGKVRFKDLREPIAIEYRGKVYLVAPFVPDTNGIPKPAPAPMKQPMKAATPKPAETQKTVEYVPRSVEQLERETGDRYPRTKKELEAHQTWNVEIIRGTKTYLGESKPEVTVYTKIPGMGHPGIGTNIALAIRDFCLKNNLAPLPKAPARTAARTTRKPKAKKPAPDLPPILTAPPELAADVLGTGATAGMRSALETAITEGFTAKPKRTTTSRKEAELAKTAAAWGRGEHTPPAAPKRKPAARTTRKKPDSRIMELRAEENQIRADIWKEIRELKPMGRRSEVGMAMGITPKRGVVVETAVGELVFAKARQPSARQLKRWESMHNKARKMSWEVAKRQVESIEAWEPAARTTRKKPVAAAPKPAKPKAKKPAAGTKLTPAQQEYLAINGFVRVKRGGKYVTITN